jgi:hypothetical protein
MFCPNCACELPAVARFCVKCGAKVELSMAEQMSQKTAVPPSSQEIPPVQPVYDLASDSSKGAEFPDSEISPPYLYAKGKNFVIPKAGILPSRCVKCGSAPTERWLNKTFSWHHPGLYFLMFSPILYVIVALIVRKRVDLAVPLCSTHKAIRRKRLWIATGLLLGCIPVPWGLIAYIGNDSGESLALWLGVTMFIVGLFFIKFASPLSAVKIGSGTAEFRGACPEFLASLRPAPDVDANVRARTQTAGA